MTISDEDLFTLMEQASQMRTELEERMSKARKSSREANYKAYQKEKIEKEYQKALYATKETDDYASDWMWNKLARRNKRH